MTEKYILSPESIIDFQIGKKIIILDPDGHTISLVLKCKKVRRDDLASDIDISTLSLKERKAAEYVMNLGNKSGYIATMLTPDEHMLDEIDETIRNLKRTRNEIEKRRNNELDRYRELRKQIQLHNSVDEFALNSEEVELFNLHHKMIQRYPNSKLAETDEGKIVRLKLELGDTYKYTSAKDIPEGKGFDNHRELLRTINRVKKRKQREREKNKQHNGATNANPLKFIPSIKSPQNVQIIESPGFIMEILPSEHNNQIKEIITTSSGLVIEILNQDSTSKEILNSLFFNSIEPDIIPEDYESQSDPLKVLTWHEYYYTDRFTNELDYDKIMNWKDWDFIQQVYIKLARSPSALKGLKSMREEYLTIRIIEKYHELRRNLPEINNFISLRNVQNLTDNNFNNPLLVC